MNDTLTNTISDIAVGSMMGSTDISSTIIGTGIGMGGTMTITRLGVTG